MINLDRVCFLARVLHSRGTRLLGLPLWFLSMIVIVSPAQALDIQVKGLFNNAALLDIDGERHLLKAGKSSPEGVKLISANSHETILEVNGKRMTLGLSQRISTSFTVAEKHEIRLAASSSGHYVTPGRINGLPVEFMVDTGATFVSMNLPTAKHLGINYRAGKEGYADTANGRTTVYVVTLAAVSVGDVEVKNVRATVHLGNFPSLILLGNSYLSRVEMARENGVLILSSQH